MQEDIDLFFRCATFAWSVWGLSEVDLMLLLLQANPPDVSQLPTEDVVGVTVVLLTCSYRDQVWMIWTRLHTSETKVPLQEFIRVGYYVNNEYEDEESRENPPSTPQIERLNRNILAGTFNMKNLRVCTWLKVFLEISCSAKQYASIQCFFLTLYPCYRQTKSHKIFGELW